MKNLSFLFIIAGMMIAACGSQTGTQTEEAAVENLLIAEVVSNPMNYEDHLVRIEGTIGHVCRHSGDKMRVVQPDDNAFSIMVMLGDYTGTITTEFEGMNVVATGKVKAQVRNLDALADHDHGDENGDDHDHEGHECSSTAEAVARLLERGISPDIRAYIELTSFEIK